MNIERIINQINRTKREQGKESFVEIVSLHRRRQQQRELLKRNRVFRVAFEALMHYIYIFFLTFEL